MGQVVLSGERFVERVGAERLAFYWPQIEVEMDLVPHVWDSWWTKESLYNGVIGGRFQLWGAGTREVLEVAILTQVAIYPAGSILQTILALGNNIEANLDSIAAAMEYFARDTGCETFELTGREGWKRLLRRFNPTWTTVTMTFAVPQERVQ